MFNMNNLLILSTEGIYLLSVILTGNPYTVLTEKCL